MTHSFEIELIVFSSEFNEQGAFKLKRRKIILVTSSFILVLGRNKLKVKLWRNITHLYAITMSLAADKFNFILHYRGIADHEFTCNK